jgi:hypothetical protein
MSSFIRSNVFLCTILRLEISRTVLFQVQVSYSARILILPIQQITIFSLPGTTRVLRDRPIRVPTPATRRELNTSFSGLFLLFELRFVAKSCVVVMRSRFYRFVHPGRGFVRACGVCVCRTIEISCCRENVTPFVNLRRFFRRRLCVTVRTDNSCECLLSPCRVCASTSFLTK